MSHVNIAAVEDLEFAKWGMSGRFNVPLRYETPIVHFSLDGKDLPAESMTGSLFGDTKRQTDRYPGRRESSTMAEI